MGKLLGRGLKGRRVRLPGRRGVYVVAAVHLNTLDACRLTPGRGGRCVEAYDVPRAAVRFLRGDFEVRP